MNINSYEIKVNYKGNYELYTNDNKVIILNQDGDISVMFKVNENGISISSISYDTEVYIHSSINKVEISISDPIEFE